MGSEYIPEYCDLPGVAGGKLIGPMVGSPSGAVSALRKHRASSSAADHGAMMIWIDDEGAYRSAFMRHQWVQAQDTFTSKAALLAWLKVWWPAMRNPEFAPPPDEPLPAPPVIGEGSSRALLRESVPLSTSTQHSTGKGEP